MGNRDRANPPTSMPVGIGTPLSHEHSMMNTTGDVQLTGPGMVHMAHVEQHRTSRKVIEVGAIAILNYKRARDKVEVIDPLLLKADTRLREKSDAPSPVTLMTLIGGSEPREKMLKNLDTMEKLLREGDDKEVEKAKRGCEMIREVLKKMEDRGGGGDRGGGLAMKDRYVPVRM